MNMSLGRPNVISALYFGVFIVASLAITYWAARRTRNADQFYTAGQGLTGLQNGLALAGDFMSAAAFLGTTGLVALSGFDGMIYAIGGIVGWPIVLVLIAEPLRNIGKYTLTDVIAYRLRQRPIRIAAAFSSLTVVLYYLIPQMVGAGNLFRMLFGLPYEWAVVLIGVVMLAYVLFGGMMATTWVQIIKAVLLLGATVILSFLVLARFGFNPVRLFDAAARMRGAAILGPGGYVANPIDAISLGMALMFGTAGLPHVLMRFYTVPDGRTARRSVSYAIGFIGAFYLMTFILGFGAMVVVGPDVIRSIDAGGNMSAPLLAEALGGTAFLGFIAAVAFATILAVVAGLTLSGAAALSHDLWANVVRSGHASEREQLRVARAATVLLALAAVMLGILFRGQNVTYMVGLAFAVAASANFPALILAISWRGFTTLGAVSSMLVGAIGTSLMIVLSPTIQMDMLGYGTAWFPLRNPAIVMMPLVFLTGITMSWWRPEPAARDGFARLQHRQMFGAQPEASGTMPALR